MGRAIVILMLIAAGAWQSAPGQPFRSETATVHIYATVLGRDGRLVPNLQRGDFTVFDNGREQPISVFDNAPQRITLALMFDMSQSMDKVHARLRTAATAFVGALWPQDRVRIGTFSDEVALSPWLTDDKAILRRIVDEELWPGGGTPLWYALDAAMASLDKETGRRVVLTFTDGKNAGVPMGTTVTFSSLDAVSKHAAQGSYMIYAIGLQDAGLTRDLTDLARETGGGHFVVGKRDDLAATFTRVVDELHHQYMIGFVQPEADGLIHDVRVSTRIGAEVRARTSYIAERSRSGS